MDVPAPEEAAPTAAPSPDAPTGRYRLDRLIGTGASGEVWKAWDTNLGRWTALKFLKNEEERERERFRREAQTAARLSHPNIASIHEVGDNYIAMQFVDGRSLLQYPRKDPRRVVRLVRQAVMAIQYAHEQGVIHRDIKPANIMVDEATADGEPRVYVLDFGFARSTDVSRSLTMVGGIVGTPRYMSPEQAQGKKRLTAQSDIYAFGATLYHLLTGQPPFSHPDLFALLRAVVNDPPVPAWQRSSKIDRGLSAIIDRCLEKDPAHRYETARDLDDDLGRWLEGETIPGLRSTMSQLIVGGVRRHRRGLLAAAVLAVTAGAPVLLYHYLRGGFSAPAQAIPPLVRTPDPKEAVIQKLADLTHALVERRQALRSGRMAPERARRELEELAKAAESRRLENPDLAHAICVRARAQLYLDQIEPARRDLEALVERRPDFAPARMLLAVTLLDVVAEEALSWTADSAVSLSTRVAPLLKRALEEVEKSAPENLAAHGGLPILRDDLTLQRLMQSLHQIYVQRGAAATAGRRELLRWWSEFPFEETAWWLALGGGSWEESLTWTGEAVATAPGWSRGQLLHGFCLLRTTKHAEALLTVNRGLELNPASAMGYYHRAAIQRQLSNRNAAFMDFQRAIDLKPNFGEAYNNRGTLWMEDKEFDKALADFERSRIACPHLYQPYQNRGIIRDQRGDLKGALEDYETALRLIGPEASARSRIQSQRDAVADRLRIK